MARQRACPRRARRSRSSRNGWPSSPRSMRRSRRCMRVLLADEDNERQVRRLYERALRDPWREFALDIGLRLTNLPTIGLPRGSSDRVVWQACQKLGLILVTGNRSKDGPDSL